MHAAATRPRAAAAQSGFRFVCAIGSSNICPRRQTGDAADGPRSAAAERVPPLSREPESFAGIDLPDFPFGQEAQAPPISRVTIPCGPSA